MQLAEAQLSGTYFCRHPLLRNDYSAMRRYHMSTALGHTRRLGSSADAPSDLTMTLSDANKASKRVYYTAGV